MTHEHPIHPKHPASEANTTADPRSNVARNDALSNDLFAAFLDETTTYSSVLFDVSGNSQDIGHPGFHLTDSESGFRAGHLGIHQLVFTRDAGGRGAGR